MIQKKYSCLYTFVANHVSTLMDKQMEILLNEALKSNAIEHTS